MLIDLKWTKHPFHRSAFPPTLNIHADEDTPRTAHPAPRTRRTLSRQMGIQVQGLHIHGNL